MYELSIVNPKAWAEHTFGTAKLGDQRRTRRAVAVAAALATNPSATLPLQMANRKDLKACYRLLEQEDVSYQGLTTPHFQHTLSQALAHPLVLLVQDTTELDYSKHQSASGLGPIGDGRGRGLMLQTVLAVVPEPRQVLGLIRQQPFLRKPAIKQSCKQRQRRERESEVWTNMVSAIGKPLAGQKWVHVADRYADIFAFMQACCQQDTEFLVRAAQERRVQTEDHQLSYLLTHARQLAKAGQASLELPAQHGQAARVAALAISYSSISILPPRHTPEQQPIAAWIVRVWEPEAPATVSEPLEWILLSSVPALSLADAWQLVAWYRCRWLVEDYHKCLKSGCLIEGRQMQSRAGLERILALLAPVAVELLRLRELSRSSPQQRAAEHFAAELLTTLAGLRGLDPNGITVWQFWHEVAQLGGYLGRQRDGPPGWQSLWRGWRYLQNVLDGVRLAGRMGQPRCG